MFIIYCLFGFILVGGHKPTTYTEDPHWGRSGGRVRPSPYTSPTVLSTYTYYVLTNFSLWLIKISHSFLQKKSMHELTRLYHTTILHPAFSGNLRQHFSKYGFVIFVPKLINFIICLLKHTSSIERVSGMSKIN